MLISAPSVLGYPNAKQNLYESEQGMSCKSHSLFFNFFGAFTYTRMSLFKNTPTVIVCKIFNPYSDCKILYPCVI